LARNRDEEATQVIAALNDVAPDSELVKLEKRIILDSMLATGEIGENSSKYKDLVTNGKTQHLRRVILGASSQIMQQIGGCNVGFKIIGSGASG
jgi:hypothetical protein